MALPLLYEIANLIILDPGSGRWSVGGDGNSGISSDSGSSRRLWRLAPRTAPLKVKPPQAAVAAWQLARYFGSGNLEISSGDFRLALGSLQMCAKFLT